MSPPSMLTNAVRTQARQAVATFRASSCHFFPPASLTCTRLSHLSINDFTASLQSRRYSQTAPAPTTSAKRRTPPQVPSNTLILFGIAEEREQEVRELMGEVKEHVTDVRIFTDKPYDVTFIRFPFEKDARRGLQRARFLVNLGKARKANFLPIQPGCPHPSVRVLGLGMDRNEVKEVFKNYKVVDIYIPDPPVEPYAFVEFDSVETAQMAQEILRKKTIRNDFAKPKYKVLGSAFRPK